MSRVLLHLVAVESRAIVRLAARRLPTKAGALAALAALVLIVGIPYAVYSSVAHQGNFGVTVRLMRSWAPEAFFGLVVLGMVSPHGLYFRPAELALLFPAPIPRRQLILYNILWRARMSLVSALWLAALAIASGKPVVASIVGYILVLLLLQTSSQWFAVVRASLAARPRVRTALKLFALAVLVLAWAGGWLVDLIHTLAWTTRPALQVLSAPTIGAAVPWVSASALTVALLVTGTCTMDSVYHEAALARGWRRHKRRNRNRGGAGSYGPGVQTAWLRVPAFPRLGGIGPVAWRQTIELVRNPRRIVLVLAVVAVAAIGATALMQLEAGNDFSIATPLMRAWVVIVVLCLAPLLSGDSLGFDFRRDLDRMATLKSLPISPAVLAAGQFVPATLFVTTVQLFGIAAVAALTESITYVAVVAMALVLPPMNWCAIAAENVLFLVAPYRTVPDDPGDMTFAGRLALASTLKMASLITLAVASVLLAAVMLRASGGSLIATVAVLVAMLVLACVPVTRLAGWAFRRFDVARDVPA